MFGRFSVAIIFAMELQEELIFEDEDYSDVESVFSDDDSFVTFDDWKTFVNSFDKFEFRVYTLNDPELVSRYQDNELFVNTILSGSRNMVDMTSIRLLADVYDNDEEDNIRWGQNIRFEISNFEDKREMYDVMMEHISNNTAPVWHRLTTDETSDKGYNKTVIYRRDYFDYCIQKPIKSKVQMTTICGEEEIHPGIFIKTITDHGIVYGSNDCLIRCLNEVLDMRLDPVEVRSKVWPQGNKFRDLHTPRHISTIAKIYGVKLMISDLSTQKRVVFNKEGSTDVSLYKCGRVIGILDRIDPSVDKRNCSSDMVFYDLETVGSDQRVYAFTWRHSSGDMTVCHDDCDRVEKLFVDKVLDTIDSVGDNISISSYAWNGSRFDNWIVLKLLKRAYNEKLWVKDIIINSGNELLTFKLTVNRINGAKVDMVFKDPKKLFSVSLSEAAEIFNINERKIEFNHDDVDSAYTSGTFDLFINKNKVRIMEYVRMDGILLEKVVGCIAELYRKEGIKISSIVTRSVASTIIWQKTIENYRILKDIQFEPHEEICNTRYNDIMDHAIGGRTQCIVRGTLDNICGIDVNSMYPFVCAVNKYPCGKRVELKPDEDPPKDKLGLYLVRILKQSYPNVIPYRRSKNYTYDWSSSKQFIKWMTSVDMFQLDSYDVISGFYWIDTTDKFYKDFMIDNYNERLSTEPGSPMNLHIKLKMNGVTGSVFQHSIREMVIIFTKDQLETSMKKYAELITVVGCQSINDKEYLVIMRPNKFKPGDPKIKLQREFCKGAITVKPWVLTMFTYSYARKLLRDEWINLENKGCKVVYCDTDSLFFVNNGSVSKSMYTDNHKQLGGWNIECWYDEGSFFAPKIYGLKNINKIRIKGVQYNSFVMNTDESNDITYNEKLEIFLKLANNNGRHPNYSSVKRLVEGVKLKTIGFQMVRSATKGIQKEYVIKTIEP